MECMGHLRKGPPLLPLEINLFGERGGGQDRFPSESRRIIPEEERHVNGSGFLEISERGGRRSKGKSFRTGPPLSKGALPCQKKRIFRKTPLIFQFSI
jgi:hypothetical protein